jgi:competence protein ComEC
VRCRSRLALAAAITLALAAFASATLELHFIDVGQGDAVLIRTPAGHTVVYDGGQARDSALLYLTHVGVERVDLVIASHAHVDHIGGLPTIVDTFRPAYFLDSGIAHTTLAYERLLRAVGAAGSRLIEPGERRITLGEVTIHVLPIPAIESWGHNDNSVGIVVEYGAFRASLLGDAEPRLQTWLLEIAAHALGPVQVHKASHHGSRRGDTEALMMVLQPRLVVISAGAGNPYGYPHQEALDLYRSFGAYVLRTDVQGTIVVAAQADGTFEVRLLGPEAYRRGRVWHGGADGRFVGDVSATVTP